jgi:hypothetical protein
MTVIPGTLTRPGMTSSMFPISGPVRHRVSRSPVCASSTGVALSTTTTAGPREARWNCLAAR